MDASAAEIKKPKWDGVRDQTSHGIRLTRRDRELIGMLGMARYLRSEQIGRLFFKGRDESATRRRLCYLAGARGCRLRAPYLRRLAYRDYEGAQVTVWALTEHGYHLAGEVLGRPLRVPKTDEVGADYLEHIIATNELLIGIFERNTDQMVSARHPGLRWISTDGSSLSLQSYNLHEHRKRQRRLLPDATIELPAARLRIFVEYESGDNALGDAKRPNSTQWKLGRYDNYLHSFVDIDRKVTWYQQRFPDGHRAEVLFVVPAAGRRDSINALIENWRRSVSASGGYKALCVDEAAAQIRKLAGEPPSEMHQAAPKRAFTLQNLELVRRYLNESVAIIKNVRHTIRKGERPAEPPYPQSYDSLFELLKRAGA